MRSIAYEGIGQTKPKSRPGPPRCVRSVDSGTYHNSKPDLFPLKKRDPYNFIPHNHELEIRGKKRMRKRDRSEDNGSLQRSLQEDVNASFPKAKDNI